MNREAHLAQIKELRKESDFNALIYWMKHGREISFTAFSRTGELSQFLEDKLEQERAKNLKGGLSS